MKKLDHKNCSVIALPAGYKADHVNNNAFQNIITGFNALKFQLIGA